MRHALLVAIFVFSQILLASASDGERITGIWWNATKDAKIKVEKEGDTFSAKIVFLRDEKDSNARIQRDKNNPNHNLTTRTILNLQIISGLIYYSAKNNWINGLIYDPKSGKTFSCTVWLEDNDNLKIKGYVKAFPLMSNTVTWARTTL
jgi:uncharacterized protein (DUF2147 family)